MVGISTPQRVTLPERVLLDELLAHRDHLVPARRRLFRIEAGVLEGVLVPVQHDGRALERNAPGLAVDLAVGHERRIEILEPRLVADKAVKRHDGVLVHQREDVGREQHRQLRRLAAFHGGHRFGHRVGVVAGIDRRHLDIGVFLLEAADHVVDDLGHGAADRDRVIHREIDRRRLARHRHQRRECSTQHRPFKNLQSGLPCCGARRAICAAGSGITRPRLFRRCRRVQAGGPSFDRIDARRLPSMRA